MSRAVDPSEILLHNEGSQRNALEKPQPWHRFLARFLDYALFLFILGICKTVWGSHFSWKEFSSFAPLEFFAWIPIEAGFLSLLGTTPGKWFFQIKLRQGRRRYLEFSVALRRSFLVWLRGVGMMIPIVDVLCLLVAYYKLKTFQCTSWDRDERIVVSHALIGQWRIAVAAVIIIAVFLKYSKRTFGM